MSKKITFENKINVSPTDIRKEEAWAEDFNEIKEAVNTNASEMDAHIDNKSNPHNLKANDVGLGLVDNTRDINKPISEAQALVNKNNAELIDKKLDKGTLEQKESLSELENQYAGRGTTETSYQFYGNLVLNANADDDIAVYSNTGGLSHLSEGDTIRVTGLDGEYAYGEINYVYAGDDDYTFFIISGLYRITDLGEALVPVNDSNFNIIDALSEGSSSDEQLNIVDVETEIEVYPEYQKGFNESINDQVNTNTEAIIFIKESIDKIKTETEVEDTTEYTDVTSSISFETNYINNGFEGSQWLSLEQKTIGDTVFLEGSLQIVSDGTSTRLRCYSSFSGSLFPPVRNQRFFADYIEDFSNTDNVCTGRIFSGSGEISLYFESGLAVIEIVTFSINFKKGVFSA